MPLNPPLYRISDTVWVRIRGPLKQAAIEEGQWTEKRETKETNIITLMDRINAGRKRAADEKLARDRAAAEGAFEMTPTRVTPRKPGSAVPATCKEENSEAFAGQYAKECPGAGRCDRSPGGRGPGGGGPGRSILVNWARFTKSCHEGILCEQLRVNRLLVHLFVPSIAPRARRGANISP